MPAEAVLVVSDLRKVYGGREAVRGVSFTVHRGEIFGVLGPNGAGKTTTLGMTGGVVPKSGGTVALVGGALGLVPQRIALYPPLTAEENLRFFGGVYGVTGHRLERRVDELLELAGLSARRHDRVAVFSEGMKRRLNLVCGLVHQPQVVLLDEPTVGIDPQSRERIYETMQGLAADGLALVLSTHYMDEAERLCSRLAILDEGACVAEGTVEQLVEELGGGRTIELELAREPKENLAASLSEWNAVPNGVSSYRIRTADAEKVLALLIPLVAQEANVVLQLRLSRPNLGDVFMELTGKELRD
ncbi:MAG TPA: ABC transporter ATP-binding protein [Vicinamibacteria bacterium]|nr:ABC transporter ATP-binding protein [Vicinamibacteria bacterium]